MSENAMTSDDYCSYLAFHLGFVYVGPSQFSPLLIMVEF